MEPEFTEGDIVIVDPDRTPENCGFIIAKNDTGTTFKQYVIDAHACFSNR
jgi:SOS-response transcriptional repressor LexA